MRRSPLARRTLAVALAATAVALAGCPTEAPEPPVDPAPPVTADIAPGVEDAEDLDDDLPDVESVAPTTTAALEGEATPAPPIGDVDPAVAIERPGDFLRPTLPNASLEDLREPAEPPEEITDRSAEAENPLVLPGGTPVGDLFEDLEEMPAYELSE